MLLLPADVILFFLTQGPFILCFFLFSVVVVVIVSIEPRRVIYCRICMK